MGISDLELQCRQLNCLSEPVLEPRWMWDRRDSAVRVVTKYRFNCEESASVSGLSLSTTRNLAFRPPWQPCSPHQEKLHCHVQPQQRRTHCHQPRLSQQQCRKLSKVRKHRPPLSQQQCRKLCKVRKHQVLPLPRLRTKRLGSAWSGLRFTKPEMRAACFVCTWSLQYPTASSR